MERASWKAEMLDRSSAERSLESMPTEDKAREHVETRGAGFFSKSTDRKRSAANRRRLVSQMLHQEKMPSPC